MNGKLHAFLVLTRMVIDLLATFIRFFLFVRMFLSEITLINPAFNTRVITGTANILSNHTLVVIDAAFGNLCKLSCSFTHCIPVILFGHF